MTLSDALLEVLAGHGVRHIFGIPGDAINDITDAIRRQDRIRFIGVRHEEAGAFAASAQAKLTGSLAVCMGTSGPGAIHLLNGLYDAKLDHAPVLAITGQVASDFIGTEYHQEVRLERLFSDVAVYSQTITGPGQALAVIEEACHAAILHRGVAHISIPTDISGRCLPDRPKSPSGLAQAGRIMPDPDACERAVELIDRSERIAILAGHGCLGERATLIDFASALKAPIVRTLKAKEVIDDDHAMCIGGLGMLGGAPGVRAMKDCDLLIMIGTDFPYRDFYPEGTKTIQIDRDPTRIGKRHAVDIGLVGDAGPTMKSLGARLKDGRDDSFLLRMQKEMEDWRRSETGNEKSEKTPIHPPRVLAALSKAAPANAVFLCDTGTATAWAARHLHIREGQRFTLSGNLASMAFALPAAIGAQLAYPDRRAVAICGDGAFTMLMGDFMTAVQHDLRIVVLVLNNEKLGFIRLELEAKGLPDWGTDIRNPDFAAFARACGGEGIRITRPEDLDGGLQQAFASDRPTVIDVHVDPDALIFPPSISLGQGLNFGLAKIREAFAAIGGDKGDGK